MLEGLDERHPVAVLGSDVLLNALFDDGLGQFVALLLILAQNQLAANQRLERIGLKLGIFLAEKLRLAGVLAAQEFSLAPHGIRHHLLGDDLVVHLGDDAVTAGWSGLPHRRAGEQHGGKDND